MISKKVQAQLEEQLKQSTVRKEVESYLMAQEAFVEELNKCYELVNTWLSHEYHLDKQARLEALAEMDLKKLVNKIIFRLITSPTKQSFFNSVVPSFVPLLEGVLFKLEDRIQTMGELLIVICKASKIVTLNRAGIRSSHTVKVNINLPKELQEKVSVSYYMTPVFSHVNELKANTDTAYMSIKKSVICGKSFNHHEDDVALDALNIINQNRLSIDYDFVETVQEPFKQNEDNLPKNFRYMSFQEKQAYWDMQAQCFENFKGHTRHNLHIIKEMGNDFSLNHKYDKRGRIYADGYVINSQGDSYRKAMLDFNKSVDIDIPQEFKL